MDTTKVTLIQKTSCYFCEEWLDDTAIKAHLLTCGQVLEKCPYNCLSYIQRKNMDQHIKTCPRRSSMILNGIKSDVDLATLGERLTIMDDNLTSLRKALNDEIQMRHDIIGELGSLKRRNQISDDWTQQVGEILKIMQEKIDEEKEERKMQIKHLNGIVKNLLEQFTEVKGFREEIGESLNRIESRIKTISERDNTSRIENTEWVNEIKKLEEELEKLRYQTSDDMNDCVKYISTINDKINQIAVFTQNQQSFADDSIVNSLSRLEKFETDIAKTTALMNNFNDRYMKTEYNVKQMMNTVHENDDKTEKIEKNVVAFSELVQNTKQSLDDLQEHLKIQRRLNTVSNIRGHLIWRITSFSRKLNEAKESEIPLKSPIFSNKQYGYTLRLDVHLNGIGTWKNRNLIACLTVVEGDYDTILPWPCKLKADIVLRDQPDNLNDATDITKLVITKKRNDKLEYQNQFIHIPHQVINSGTYIRNDSIILEVKIQKTYENYAKIDQQKFRESLQNEHSTSPLI